MRMEDFLFAWRGLLRSVRIRVDPFIEKTEHRSRRRRISRELFANFSRSKNKPAHKEQRHRRLDYRSQLSGMMRVTRRETCSIQRSILRRKGIKERKGKAGILPRISGLRNPRPASMSHTYNHNTLPLSLCSSRFNWQVNKNRCTIERGEGELITKLRINMLFRRFT